MSKWEEQNQYRSSVIQSDLRNSTVMTVPGDHVVHQSDRRNLNCRDRSWRICWSVNRFYISGRCGQGDKIHRWITSEMKQFHSVTSIHGDADETTVMFHWWTSTLVDKIQGGTLLRVNGLNRLCSIRGTWPGWKMFPQGSTELNSLVVVIYSLSVFDIMCIFIIYISL